MKVLFHNESLNYRGVTNSTVDYAEFNEKILGNESALAYNGNFTEKGLDIYSQDKVIRKLSKKYEVISYSSPEELNQISKRFDVVYAQKAGDKAPPFVDTTKFVVHTVFQYHQPHGDVYAYISEWLAKEIKKNYKLKTQPPFVPYIVDMPTPDHRGGSYLRTRLGIPKNKFVYGRHGGFFTFDLPGVKKVISKVVQENPNIVFLFANTQRFFEHPNIYYLEPFFGNQMKSNFIAACDAMIHGRRLGESFGNSIAEFLFFDKPVLAWEGGYDRNHANWLEPYGLLYSEKNLEKMMLDLPNRPKQDYKGIVAQYSPEEVMKKFKEVYL
jgi:hypothetical protein